MAFGFGWQLTTGDFREVDGEGKVGEGWHGTKRTLEKRYRGGEGTNSVKPGDGATARHCSPEAAPSTRETAADAGPAPSRLRPRNHAGVTCHATVTCSGDRHVTRAVPPRSVHSKLIMPSALAV